MATSVLPDGAKFCLTASQTMTCSKMLGAFSNLNKQLTNPATVLHKPHGATDLHDTTNVLIAGGEILSLIGVVLVIRLLLNRRQQHTGRLFKSVIGHVKEYQSTLVKEASQVGLDDVFHGLQCVQNPISVSFEGLGLELPSGEKLLDNVSGTFEAEQLSAVMGPSGCGKTTFVKVLSGKARYGQVSGTVKINGEEQRAANLRMITGFVPQQDILHARLNIREQILFSARLRNPSSTPTHVINSIVEDILTVLQLKDKQDLIVGGYSDSGISGGQRKRVNIAMELAANPALLVLDEPTSGLDAATARDIVNALKLMTTELGMTIVTVIHQPRYAVFTTFDHLQLLDSKGTTVYLGPPTGAVPHFQGLGLKSLAEGENAADWLLDIVSTQEVAKWKGVKLTQATADSPSKRITGIASFFSASPACSSGGSPEKTRNRTGAWRESTVKALAEKWDSVVVKQRDVIDKEMLGKVLVACAPKGAPAPADEVVDELFQQMGAEELGGASRAQFLEVLSGTGTTSGVAAGKGGAAVAAEKEGGRPRARAPSGGGSALDIVSLDAGFLQQYIILLERRALKSLRSGTERAWDLGIVVLSAVLLGAMMRGDDLSTNNIALPAKLLQTHVALALLVAIQSLRLLGEERQLFLRERARGLNVLAFYLASLTIYAFDWFLSWALFSEIWYVIAQPQIHPETSRVALGLAGFVAAGCSLFLSSFLPQGTANLATGSVIFLMGGAFGAPDYVASLTTTTGAPSILGRLSAGSSFTRWSVGMAWLRTIEMTGGQETLPCDSISSRYYEAFDTGPLPTSLKVGDIFENGWFLDHMVTTTIILSTMAFWLLLGGYLGLLLVDRSKQV